MHISRIEHRDSGIVFYVDAGSKRFTMSVQSLLPIDVDVVELTQKEYEFSIGEAKISIEASDVVCPVKASEDDNDLEEYEESYYIDSNESHDLEDDEEYDESEIDPLEFDDASE